MRAIIKRKDGRIWSGRQGDDDGIVRRIECKMSSLSSVAVGLWYVC